MKWKSVSSYPFGWRMINETEEQHEQRLKLYRWVIDYLGFDKWARYTPVKNLHKLLNGERSYNAGKYPADYPDVDTTHQWLDHAIYLKDTKTNRVALLTQPYDINDGQLEHDRVKHNICSIECSPFLSFYYPDITMPCLLCAEKDVDYYVDLTTKMEVEVMKYWDDKVEEAHKAILKRAGHYEA